MSELKFAIGDMVWRATFQSTETRVICPDCGGSTHFRCILFDGSEVAVPCEGCKSGWEGPTGRVRAYERRGQAELGRVVGIDIRDDGTEYRVGTPTSAWICKEGDIFRSEEEALDRAAEMAVDYDAAEKARLQLREKPHRSWAWHVHYHRQCLRRARKDIEHHEQQLSVARIKAKLPKDDAP